MTAPEQITELAPGEVFVFGSNTEGRHAGGAAAVAVASFGAQWGVGEGLQGNAYALPTMEGWEALEDAVDRFLYFASRHPDLTFVCTPIGCGIAGYRPEQVAPLFRVRTANVELPAVFEAVLA